MNRRMLFGFVVVITLSINSSSQGAIVVAGADYVGSSTSVFTITINDPFFPGGFTETLNLESGAFHIHRQQQQGDGNGGVDDFIDTEILDMTLTGNSVNVGPVSIRVGSDNGVQHSGTLGQITNVRSNPEGTFDLVGPEDFVSGDSFFDIFFEVDAGGQTFYNRDPHRIEYFGITSLPPNGTHIPPGAGVDLFMRIGPTNDISDPLVGFSTGNHTVPEPVTGAVSGLALMSLVAIRRRRQMK